MKIKKIHKIALSSLVFSCLFLQTSTSLASGNSFNVYYYERVNIDKSYIGSDKKHSDAFFKANNYSSSKNTQINSHFIEANKEYGKNQNKRKDIIKNNLGPLSPSYRLGLSPQELALVINTAFPKNKLIKDNDFKLINGFTETLVELENELGINPFFILGIINAENPILHGKFSNIVKNKNNLMSWTAYDHDPYNKATKFNSYSAAIIHPARFLSKNYLNPKGKYYVDGSVEGVNKHYATAKNWHKNVTYGMKRLNDTRISLGF